MPPKPQKHVSAGIQELTGEGNYDDYNNLTLERNGGKVQDPMMMHKIQFIF